MDQSIAHAALAGDLFGLVTALAGGLFGLVTGYQVAYYLGKKWLRFLFRKNPPVSEQKSEK